MKTLESRPRQPRNKGFTLVEVVLAIGIVAFVLISILGLMSVGLKASRESADDIAIGLIIQHVATSLRMEGFAKVNENAGYAAGEATPDFFYDSMGTRSANGGRSSDGNTLYACTVSRSSPDPNLLLIKLRISWPVAAADAKRQKRIAQISLSNRE